MCGLAGIYGADAGQALAQEWLAAMISAQRHRGPDGSGFWSAPGVALGHCRLAVMDPVGSPQPMHNHAGDLTLVYNGEVYNFAALRTELQALGHRFHSAGDTEVILNGYRQWGLGVLPRLSGMFAFALYDHRNKRLVLARDPLGVKPLHYAKLADGTLIFASELKGLMAHPRLLRRPSLRAVEDYFALGYIPDDACILDGVQKLPAASYLVLDPDRPLAAPISYWDIEFAPDHSRSAADAADHCRSLIGQAVRSRMVADVPLGAFLSGGVDSSTVVAFMAQAQQGPVETCSIGFDGPLDETAFAQRVADLFQTHHRSRRVGAQDVALVDQLATIFDEPFADASALPMVRLCALARERVRVALSGDGADELFAGYRRYVFFDAEERLRSFIPKIVRRPIFGLMGQIYPKADWAPRWLRAKATLQAVALDSAEAYARAVAFLPVEARHKLFTATFRNQLQGYRAEDRYVAVMGAAPAADALGRAQYADLKIWLPGDILTKMDRTSMSQSLEVREPLLDRDLLAFAARLPRADRVRFGQGKWRLKQALSGVLPAEVLNRPKMGFVAPLPDWFRGPLAQEADRLCCSAVIADTGWFSMPFLKSCVAAHRSGRADHGRFLWQMLMFERAYTRLFTPDTALR